jgi:Plasmid pRiA4b ORF-3-like protein
MATKTPSKPALTKLPSGAYLLRIELCHLDPVIYREVLVAPSMSLAKLHGVIQAAMGWEDCHMYGFARHSGKGGKARGGYWGASAQDRFEPPSENLFDSDAAASDRTTLLRDVLKKPKDKLFYLYDFGDNWEHLITLKSIEPEDGLLPRLMKAEHACPPEDCGGMGGFINMIQAFVNPQDPEHHDVREWLGEDFEPGALDFKALEAAVKRIQPKKRASAV